MECDVLVPEIPEDILQGALIFCVQNSLYFATGGRVTCQQFGYK